MTFVDLNCYNQWFHSFSQRFRDRQADAAATNQTKPQVYIQKALDHVIVLPRFKVRSVAQPQRKRALQRLPLPELSTSDRAALDLPFVGLQASGGRDFAFNIPSPSAIQTDVYGKYLCDSIRGAYTLVTEVVGSAARPLSRSVHHPPPFPHHTSHPLNTERRV